jgi:hypothetical protein
MIQILIKLQVYIQLYLWGNLPYSKYVITPEKITLFHTHVLDFMEVYGKYHSIPNDLVHITIDTLPQRITEGEFLTILQDTVNHLESSKIKIDAEIQDTIGPIIQDLTTWMNIFFAH